MPGFMNRFNNAARGTAQQAQRPFMQNMAQQPWMQQGPPMQQGRVLPQVQGPQGQSPNQRPQQMPPMQGQPWMQQGGGIGPNPQMMMELIRRRGFMGPGMSDPARGGLRMF